MASSRRSAAAGAAPDIWECRYFFTHPPEAFEHDRMSRRFPSVSGPFDDDDVYLVADDAKKNIKLRRRTSRIKLKRMIDCEDDGFELWRTELDCPLPAPAQAWTKLLSWLRVKSDARTFLACSTPEEAIEAMRGAVASFVCVMAFKHRLFYAASPITRIEAGQVEISGTRLSTVVFESTSLNEARALRDQFACELETPDNYVGLISSIIPT
jgi:hypothetical protein